MTTLANFHFIRPAWLMCLPVIALLAWQLGRRTDALRGWRRLIEPDLLGPLTVGGRRTPPGTAYALLAAWLIAVIAVAGPTWQRAPSPFGDSDAAVMIVMKASESMNATDLAPDRQERARLEIADFARERPGKPLGLIAYAGTAHLVLPPTRDVELVASMAVYIDSEVMPVAGDDLAAALALARQTLAGSATGGGMIWLLTDSVQDGQQARLTSFREEDTTRIAILPMLGAGSSDHSLRKAAKILDADWVGLTADQSDTRSLLRLAAAVPAGADSGNGKAAWREAGYWLVPLLVPLVLLGFRRRAEHVSVLVLLAIGALGSNPAEARAGSLFFSPDQLGQRYFSRGDYLAAAESFANAQWKGVAYYRAGEFKLAEQAFARGVEPEDFYNRGNALLMQGKYSEAIGQYDRALELRAAWPAALANRRIAETRAERTRREGGEMTGGQLEADEVVFDLEKGARNAGRETVEGATDRPVDDKTLEALWLRNVQTSPGDFLRSKFSYQVAERNLLPASGQPVQDGKP